MIESSRSVEIVIPIYNGAAFLPSLLAGLKKQQESLDFATTFLLSPSQDDAESILQKEGVNYRKLDQFDHAKTREEAILSSSSDVVIMMTQDVLLEDPLCFIKLRDSLKDGVILAYARQVGKGIGVERYIRHCNYPRKSEIRDASSIEKKGLQALFCSDACMAYDVAAFRKLGGYDGKCLPSNEDMYYARKVLTSGYKICYCSEAYVIHSHRFSYGRLKKRYELTGRFFAENPEFAAYKTRGAGLRLAWSVFWRILVTLNVYAFVLFFPNMLARYLGMRSGLNVPPGSGAL